MLPVTGSAVASTVLCALDRKQRQRQGWPKKTRMTTLKERILTTLLHVLLRVLALLPLRFMRLAGIGLGRMLWLLQTAPRRTTEMNLALCFPGQPDAKRRALARDSLAHLGMGLAELPAVWTWPKARLMAKVQSEEGLSLLQEADAGKRGTLLLAPHLGNWEFLAIYIPGQITRTAAFIYKAPRGWGDEELHRIRGRGGAQPVHADRRGLALLLQLLRAGKTALILPDQEPEPEAGTEVPFFGVPALTANLSVKLAQRTGARVLCCFILRSPGGFMPVIRKADPDIYAENMTTAVAALNRSMENCVRQAPEQYLWSYKRFKHTLRKDGRKY